MLFIFKQLAQEKKRFYLICTLYRLCSAQLSKAEKGSDSLSLLYLKNDGKFAEMVYPVKHTVYLSDTILHLIHYQIAKRICQNQIYHPKNYSKCLGCWNLYICSLHVLSLGFIRMNIYYVVKWNFNASKNLTVRKMVVKKKKKTFWAAYLKKRLFEVN